MEKDYEPNPAIRTVRAQIRCFLLEIEGTFRLTDIYDALGAKTADEKRAIRVGLNREKGKTVENTSSYGTWRKINEKIEFLNLSELNGDFTGGIEVSLPLNLNKLVELYPGDLIVLAGVTNTGKSSFALEFAIKNNKSNPITYLSSELTREAIQERARINNIRLESLKDIKFAMRSDDFQDVIKNDGSFYIVDYIQAPGDSEPKYFAIPHIITKIHNKLESKGLLLICLQKDEGKRSGEGGFKTLHRASLYLTTDKDESGRYWANIQKCKAKSKIEGYRLQYKLLPFGLKPLSDWIPRKVKH